MVNYTCEKCNKEYDHKGSYLKHLQRKLPCDSKEKIKFPKKSSKSVIQKMAENNNNNNNNNNNYDSDRESFYETNSELSSIPSSKISSRVSSRTASRVSSRVASRRNSLNDIGNIHNIDNINIEYNDIQQNDIQENNIQQNNIERISIKKNSKNKVNNVTFETPQQNCEIINGDFLVMDKLLDKISTLLSNSSHNTNIYVKDNATIIYNAYKNDDFNKNYLEHKQPQTCKETSNKTNKTNKTFKNNFDSSILA